MKTEFTPQTPKITLLRTHFSSYFKRDFPQREQEILERALPYVKYATNWKEVNPRFPLILLTNTDFEGRHLEELMSTYRIPLVVHPNSGFDRFPKAVVDAFAGHVVVGNPIRAKAVAEYALGCFWKAHLKVPGQAQWEPGRRFERTLVERKRILIVGAGHIAHLVRDALNPLGTPYLLDAGQGSEAALGAEAFDFIILLPGLTMSSENRVDEGFLEKYAHPETVLINPSRGAVVKEEALMTFLKANPRAQAYLDVFQEEPEGLADFSGLPNAHTTSHIAGVHTHLEEDMIHFELEVVRDFFNCTENQFREKYKNLLLKEKPAQEFYR